jgi:outer membrane receptor protein involved in Fe transport
MTPTQLIRITLPLALIAGCAAPAATTDTAYHEQEVVTGSRVPRKTPQNVEAVNGDSVRMRGTLGNSGGRLRQPGMDSP